MTAHGCPPEAPYALDDGTVTATEVLGWSTP